MTIWMKTRSKASKMPISYSDGHKARRSRSLPHQLLRTAKSMYVDGETHIRSPKFGNMPRPPKMPICAQYIPLSSSGCASMTAAIVSGRPDCFRPFHQLTSSCSCSYYKCRMPNTLKHPGMTSDKAYLYQKG